MTVAAWIRAQRLDGCCRDLANPALHATSVGEIATRLGFGHPAAVSRAFRATHGVSPRDHRQQTGASLRRPTRRSPGEVEMW